MKNKKGDLRIWWISNPPRKPFRRRVNNIEEATKFIEFLAAYDLYLESLISMNAGGLEVWENGEWSEYYDEESGNDIVQTIEEKAK